MLYHYQRLILLKHDFITKMKTGQVNSIQVIESKSSAISLVSINKAFITSTPSGIEDQSVMHKMVIYIAGLVIAAIGTSGEDVDEYLKVLIKASGMISTGPRLEGGLEKCREDKSLALGLLASFRNSNVY
jgi:hypothetical protein